jgi:hypothetical protein
MVLLARHLARHRLREPQLLEAIAHFLVAQEAQLSSKVGLPPTLPFPSVSHPRRPGQARFPVQLVWPLSPEANTPAARLLCSISLGVHLYSLPQLGQFP